MGKRLLLPICILIAAYIGYTQFSKAEENSNAIAPLSKRLTFDYKGTVKGLFDTITQKSGTKYIVDANVASLPFNGSFKEKSVVQIQSAIAHHLPVRYRPPGKRDAGIHVQRKQ